MKTASRLYWSGLQGKYVFERVETIVRDTPKFYVTKHAFREEKWRKDNGERHGGTGAPSRLDLTTLTPQP